MTGDDWQSYSFHVQSSESKKNKLDGDFKNKLNVKKTRWRLRQMKFNQKTVKRIRAIFNFVN
jgi:hypothetical protein